jgi:hypothetical protein
VPEVLVISFFVYGNLFCFCGFVSLLEHGAIQKINRKRIVS